jgi:hypothetical protein
MRRTTTELELPHDSEVTLPDGRTLTEGVEFTVPGEGRFRFLYVWLPDGSIAASPVKDGVSGRRSFKPEQITTIHRKNTPSKEKP